MGITKTLHAIYDGEAFRPEESVDLEVGKRYFLIVESKQEINEIEDDPAFDLSSLAVQTNISDLSTEHDHYLYRIPKRRLDSDI